MLLSTSASCDITGKNQFLEAQPERGMPSSEGVEERRSRHQNGWNWNRVLAGMAQSPVLRISAVRVLELRTNCGKSHFSLVLPFNLSPGQPGDVLGGHCLKCYLRCSWKTVHAFILFTFACIYVYHVCVWYRRRPKGGHQIPGSGITGACEPQCVYWLSILNPLVIDPESSGRATGALNSLTISPTPRKLFSDSSLCFNNDASYV